MSIANHTRRFGGSLTLCALSATVLFGLSACSGSGSGTSGGASSEVSPTVLKANAEMGKTLDLADPRYMEDAKRGFIAKPTGQIKAADGTVLKDFDAYAFLEGAAPDSVNPSLWHHAQLNAQVGLFKVTDGVYQLRGFDISNMTLIEGKTGFILVDPLTAKESATFALEFARKHLGNKPVTGLIMTHAHPDHFGGAQGVITNEDVQARKVPVVASYGFMEEATSENIMAGTAMGRRSMLMYGKNLPRSAKGNVDTGLGKDVVYGSLGILPPNWIIVKSTQPMQIDGMDFIFHNTPGAECPAELTFSLPSKKLYNGAEILAQTMHNVLTIRGSKVRDSLLWSKYLQNALDDLGDTEIYIAQHNQPIWGNQRIREFITVQRDIYKYTHDQTVRLMNQGKTPREIADLITLPESLSKHMGARGYYGDLRHNVKAVYQFYLGFYDGNPANLNPLPPVESGKRFMELIGADKALSAAQTAYDKGDFRWAAELLNHAVMADSGNKAARELLAKTFEQMGYMSEAATWRNAYLTAAMELREGPPTKGISKANAIDMLQHVPTDRFLEAMAASLNGPDAVGKDYKINLTLTDSKEQYLLWLENGVMHFKSGASASDANASLALTRNILVKMVAGIAGIKDTIMSDDLKVTGSKIDLVRFFSLIEKAPGTFPIVTR